MIVELLSFIHYAKLRTLNIFTMSTRMLQAISLRMALVSKQLIYLDNHKQEWHKLDVLCTMNKLS